jgi:ferric-dicitrate binding protein FerR (iron transport regulator)
MSAYTDNLEAAVARADAADRKVEELKRELAELKQRREFPDLDPICPPAEFFSFWRRPWARLLFLGLLLAGLICFYIVCRVGCWRWCGY